MAHWAKSNKIKIPEKEFEIIYIGIKYLSQFEGEVGSVKHV